MYEAQMVKIKKTFHFFFRKSYLYFFCFNTSTGKLINSCKSSEKTDNVMQIRKHILCFMTEKSEPGEIEKQV